MFIRGIGRTKFGVLSNSLPVLAYEAMINALNDSTVGIIDIDAIFISNFLGGPVNGQLHLNSVIASLIPEVNIPILRIETACASSSVALNQALHCINNFENIMIIGVEKMTGPGLIPITDAIAMAGDYEADYKNGLVFPAAYALIAQQYMRKYGIDHSLLEEIAYLNHCNSRMNPLAHFYYKEVTREMIRSSPIVAEPLNLFDCSPVSDGAAAVIVSNKKESDRDIEILSSRIATDTISITQRRDLTSFKSTIVASSKAYNEANIGPGDIDILEVHDCFTISELIALEDLGMCGPGKAIELIENGEISINGSIPVNTDGGLKANGHPIGATGLAQIYEVITQLRSEAGKRQVENPEFGMTQNIGGIGGTCGITIFGV
ncbi:MAG: thiolase domain-containing protein [Methanomicrobiaceae archaeon]|nr:thiolase domain-containing protein [Methanomicrobiaceae archaeon]